MEVTTKDGYTLDVSENLYNIFVRKDNQLIGCFMMTEIIRDGKVSIPHRVF